MVKENRKKDIDSLKVQHNICTAVNRLARFERVKRRSAANEMERFEKEKEEERSFSITQCALRGFRNDHVGYCKGSER